MHYPGNALPSEIDSLPSGANLPPEAAAKRLAASLGARAELRPEPTTTGSAVVRFGSGGYYGAARSIGKMLTTMGYAWRIENAESRSDAPPEGVLEVWLPAR